MTSFRCPWDIVQDFLLRLHKNNHHFSNRFFFLSISNLKENEKGREKKLVRKMQFQIEKEKRDDDIVHIWILFPGHNERLQIVRYFSVQKNQQKKTFLEILSISRHSSSSFNLIFSHQKSALEQNMLHCTSHRMRVKKRTDGKIFSSEA